ncbi:MAG: HlyD family efflux transporter periplasmic adaptor subunit [Synoicihabitans sp.]
MTSPYFLARMFAQSRVTSCTRALLSGVALWVALIEAPGVKAEGEEFLTGIVYPLHDLELSLPLEGTVSQIMVSPGDHVQEDQVLLQLDDRLQKLEVARRERIWRDDSQIQSAQENLELLESLVATKEELFESSRTVSESELKRNRIQFNQAQGEYRALMENQARAELEFKIAAAILDSYQLKAPQAGQVVEIIPEEGEWARTGEPIIRLVNTSTCFLDLDVDLATARRITSPNTSVKVEVPTGEATLVREGRVEFVSSVADVGSGLVRVKVYFPNTDGAVTPGVTGQLLID